MPYGTIDVVDDKDALQRFLCRDNYTKFDHNLLELRFNAVIRCSKYARHFTGSREAKERMEDLTSVFWGHLSELKPTSFNPEYAVTTFFKLMLKKVIPIYYREAGLPPMDIASDIKNGEVRAVFVPTKENTPEPVSDKVAELEAHIDAAAIMEHADDKLKNVLNLHIIQDENIRDATKLAGMSKSDFYRKIKGMRERIEKPLLANAA